MSQPSSRLFSAKAIAGYALIAVGILFMLENLGIIGGYSLWEFWPVVLIAVGVGHAFRPGQQGQRVWGLVEIAFGLFFLLRTLGVFWISIWKVVPAILVVGGAYLIWQAVRSAGRAAALAPGGPGGAVGAGEPVHYLNEFALFGGGNRTVRSLDFRGGDVSVIFGGFEIDLRDVTMAADSATVDVFALFGGVVLRVPETWNVVLNATAILGSSEYKPRPVVAPDRPSKALMVTGVVICGGIEVKH